MFFVRLYITIARCLLFFSSELWQFYGLRPTQISNNQMFFWQLQYLDPKEIRQTSCGFSRVVGGRLRMSLFDFLRCGGGRENPKKLNI